MLCPDFGDLIVHRLPVLDGCAPIPEDSLCLLGCALLARDGENVTNTLRQRICRCIHIRSQRKPVPADVVASRLSSEFGPPCSCFSLMVRIGAGGKRDGAGERKHGLARLVAESRPVVDAPGGVGVLVDRVFDRTGYPPTAALVLEDGLENCLSRTHVSSRFGDLDFRRFLGRVGRGGLDFKLGQRAASLLASGRVRRSGRSGSVRSSSRNACTMFWASVFKMYFDRHSRRRIAPASNDPSFIGRNFWPPVEMSSTSGVHRSPRRLIIANTVFPRCHSLLPVGVPMLQVRFEFTRATEDLRALHLVGRSVDRNVGFMGVVDEREQAVILFLLQWIVLVVVALCALDRDAEDRLCRSRPCGRTWLPCGTARDPRRLPR